MVLPKIVEAPLRKGDEIVSFLCAWVTKQFSRPP